MKIGYNKELKHIQICLQNGYPAFCLFIVIVLLNSCAQIVAPTGGKIDAFPPKVVKYSPDSASLNFTAREITVVFDEFIQLRDLNSQLIISPPLEFIPDVKAKNKELIISFDKNEKLKPNTTYSLNFGNAVQDIHESKPADNFKYVFSTGNAIDTLAVNGKIQMAFDQKADKGVLVMLYRDFNDSSIYKNLPDYFGKTKEDGSFIISHVRAGKYKIMALKDANANYKYDTETESVGFIDTLINVTRNVNVSLSLFQQPAKKLFLKYSAQSYGHILLAFNKPTDNITVKPMNHSFGEKDIFIDFSKNKDTLNYWFRNIDKDSLLLQISNNNQVFDTVSFKLVKKVDALKSNRTPLKFKLENSPDKNQNFELNAEFPIVFNYPIDPVSIENLKSKEIKLIADSVAYEGYNNLVYQQKSLNAFTVSKKSDKGQALLIPPLKENTKYSLLILPGTFSDIFGFTNDSINISFKTREEKQYGSIKLKLEIPETKANYIVQLLDEKENVIREHFIKKSETINYQYILPKKYKLKIIVDENSNFKWDTGVLAKKQQPEKTIYNAELITTRPNWDFELEWKVTP